MIDPKLEPVSANKEDDKIFLGNARCSGYPATWKKYMSYMDGPFKQPDYFKQGAY